MTGQSRVETATEPCYAPIIFYLPQITLGTVNNVEEGVKWLSYTYLYTRMRKNPLAYGINANVFEVGFSPLKFVCQSTNFS